MINKNEYEIRTGVRKEELDLLNEYLKYVEENCLFSKQLSKIIDEEPLTLFSPKKVKLEGEFNFNDLAFIYLDSKIVGYFCHHFCRELTEDGRNNTTIKLLEKNVPADFLDDYRKLYIMERMNNKLEIGIKYEKNCQK